MRVCAILVTVMAVALAAREALGQSAGIGLSSPRAPGQGATSPSDRLRNASPGVGRSGGVTPETGALRSSISDPETYSFGRSAPPPPPGGSIFGTVEGPDYSRPSQLYTPETVRFDFGQNRLQGGAISRQFAEYADAVANESIASQSLRRETGLLGQRQGPITSLVPAGEGIFHQLMKEGEAAFRNAQYVEAEQKFDLAFELGRYSLECVLSQAHARLAIGRYASMAYEIRRAVALYPALPRANFQIRALFRNPAEYVEMRERLRSRTERWPNDARQWFALGYMEWFDNDPQAAREALMTAARVCTDPDLAEAIETFWQGCVSTGKIEGHLPIHSVHFGTAAAMGLGSEAAEQDDAL